MPGEVFRTVMVHYMVIKILLFDSFFSLTQNHIPGLQELGKMIQTGLLVI